MKRRSRQEIEAVFADMRDHFIVGFEQGCCREMTDYERIVTNERYRLAAEQAWIREQIR